MRRRHVRALRVGDHADAARPEARVVLGPGDLGAEGGAELAPDGRDVDAQPSRTPARAAGASPRRRRPRRPRRRSQAVRAKRPGGRSPSGVSGASSIASKAAQSRSRSASNQARAASFQGLVRRRHRSCGACATGACRGQAARVLQVRRARRMRAARRATTGTRGDGRPASERLQEPGGELDRHQAADLHFDEQGIRDLPDAEELQLFLELWRAGHRPAPDHDRHRRVPGDVLHAQHAHGVRQRRADHARRELRLAAALRARDRRVDVLHRRLYPSLPRALLRLLQEAARAAVDARRAHPADHDGDRVHGLRAALGADVVLGCDGHHQPVLRDPGDRQGRSSPGCGADSRSPTRR